MNETNSPLHLDAVDRYLPSLESFYPPWVACIDLPQSRCCRFSVSFIDEIIFQHKNTATIKVSQLSHSHPNKEVVWSCNARALMERQMTHYVDVIMTTMASQITSLTVVYSTAYSDADQRKHQSSASLAFVWGLHRDRWIPRTKGQLRGKCFHLMTSSWVFRGSKQCMSSTKTPVLPILTYISHTCTDVDVWHVGVMNTLSHEFICP